MIRRSAISAVEGGLPGITATVLVAGGGAWSGAAGTADGVHPVKVRSQFGIASITKMVIAAEVMRLSEHGLLRLSDPVSEHLPPSFHFDTNGATIENLLSMESGIPDPALSETADAVKADPLREWTAEEVLASVSESQASDGNGSGCMASDSGTLALWGYLLFGGQLLSAQSLLAMTDFGTGEAYDGYGLGVFDHTPDLGGVFGVPAVGHGGRDDGMINTTGDPGAVVVHLAQTLASSLER